MRDAEVAFREALRLGPGEGAHQNGLALVLAAFPGRPRSDYEEALENAKKAAEQNPGNGNRRATVALAQYRLGHWTESLAACEQAMTLQGGCDALTGFLFALAGVQTGEKETALRAFDTAVEWMKGRNSDYPTLCQLWTEAADLLGRQRPNSTKKPGKE
jgi:tetratricopeptide (TPR) repeat protein